MQLLNAVFIAQLVLLLPVFAVLLARPVTLGTALLLFYLIPVCTVVVLYAAWQFLRHPSRRRRALQTAATPIVCLALPFPIHSINGGPVAPAFLIATVAALIVVTVFAVLAGSSEWQEAGLLRSDRFNTPMLIALGLLGLLWFPACVWLAARDALPWPTDIEQRDAIIRIALLYFGAVALPALCLSLWALVHGPVGLFRNPGGRIIHVGQIAIAFVLLTSLAIAALGIAIASVNPG